MGVVSPLGHEVDTFYNSLLEGKSGVDLIESFDTGDFTTKIAAEVKSLDVDGYILKKWEKRVDKVIKYLIVAGKKALGHAGLPWEGPELKDLDRQRCGILIGSAMGGMGTFAAGEEALVTAGYRKMNPFCIPFTISNMGGAMLAMDLGFMGPNYPLATACATGNYCIMSAAEHIRRGEADLMLAGGSEAAVIPSGIGGFIACKALSRRNDDPAAASRPWDRNRDGFVMGEGAGALVLEELEHAKARGATILAEFVGGAFSSDAYSMTEPRPDGSGVAHCVQVALERCGLQPEQGRLGVGSCVWEARQRCGLQPEQVNYVNAHATSTPAGDLAEYRAITSALPHKSLKINSSKSMIGHLLGAAGAVEAVATVQALLTGYVHPNLNLENPEEELDLSLLVGPQKEKLDIDVALSNSFGFGGHNSCILFRKYKD
ncbi:hypothetical protein N2152v2_010568 [Parachlorella kessleri]